jgi:hypothetical protein
MAGRHWLLTPFHGPNYAANDVHLFGVTLVGLVFRIGGPSANGVITAFDGLILQPVLQNLLPVLVGYSNPNIVVM